MSFLWLALFNWFQLALAFILGVAAARWVMAGSRGASREELLADLASERTRRQEIDAARARERSRVAELEALLSDAQKTSGASGGSVLEKASVLGKTNAPEKANTHASATPPSGVRAQRKAVADMLSEHLPETAGVVGAPNEASSMSEDKPRDASSSTVDEAVRAALSDLSRINGVGVVLSGRLRQHGVTSIADIARWSEADITRFDQKLETAGAVRRQDWVGQAQRLTAQARDETPMPANRKKRVP